jgi:formate dehydrogenase major subunit
MLEDQVAPGGKPDRDTRPLLSDLEHDLKPCRIEIDGRTIEALAGDTIHSAARRAGIHIPALCADPRIKPTGQCGLCIIQVDGSEAPVKACATIVADGMVIATETEILQLLRKSRLIEYLTDHNAYCQPPCQDACPAGIDVAGYIDLITQKKYVEATALIKEMLPLPGVLGRVCPRPCETPCRRRQIDGEAVAICSLKRFAADKALEAGLPTQPLPAPSTGKRVAVVGAGPAGLSAAYYLALKGHKVVLYDAERKAGGMLRYGIPTYRLPDSVLDQEIRDILSLGVDFIPNQRLGRDFTLARLKTDGFDAVFLSIGAMSAKKSGIEGEENPGVMSAIEFLARVNSGEHVNLGERVIVIGGGFTAADAVRTARREGARHVTMMYRRTKKEMSAAAHEIHDCEMEGIQFDLLAAPIATVSENGRIIGLTAQRMSLGEPDSSGRSRPVPVPGSEYFTPADTILLAIGQDVDAAGLKDDAIELTNWATISVDEETMMTNIPGVFSGGDCVTGAATVVEGVGAGRKAAFAIDAFLNGADRSAIAKAIYRPKPRFFDIGAGAKSAAPLVPMTVIPADARLASFPASGAEETALSEAAFAEVELGYSEDDALREAGRCLLCRCQAAGVCKLQSYSLSYGAGTKVFRGSGRHHDE